MKLINTCLECDYQWEQNFPIGCPQCGSSDYFTTTNYDYQDIAIEDALDMQQKGFCMVCDADNHEVDFNTEV